MQCMRGAWVWVNETGYESVLWHSLISYLLNWILICIISPVESTTPEREKYQSSHLPQKEELWIGHSHMGSKSNSDTPTREAINIRHSHTGSVRNQSNTPPREEINQSSIWIIHSHKGSKSIDHQYQSLSHIIAPHPHRVHNQFKLHNQKSEYSSIAAIVWLCHSVLC